jgi:hypothetical protein
VKTIAEVQPRAPKKGYLTGESVHVDVRLYMRGTRGQRNGSFRQSTRKITDVEETHRIDGTVRKRTRLISITFTFQGTLKPRDTIPKIRDRVHCDRLADGESCGRKIKYVRKLFGTNAKYVDGIMTVRKEGCQGKEAEEDVESCFYASLLDSLCLSRDVLAG